jgi:hypothetical protein
MVTGHPPCQGIIIEQFFGAVYQLLLLLSYLLLSAGCEKQRDYSPYRP